MNFRKILAFILATSSCWGQNEDIVINPELATSDTHPAVIRSADDSGFWFTWHGYAEGSDGIYVRKITNDGALGEITKLSGSNTVHSPPEISNGPSVCWSERHEGRWRIQRALHGADGWSAAEQVNENQTDAIYVHEKPQLVYSEKHEQRDHFEVRSITGRLSNPDHDAFRPTSAGDWAAWDEYDGQRYRVILQPMKGNGIPFEISASNANGLTPRLLETSNKRLYVTWLEKVDVIGGEGAISQMHTLHAAQLVDGRWEKIEGTGAELTQGLMARIEPKPLATGGYLGRRTSPMLLESDDAVWLLWERKSNHRGSTPNVTGDLLGRPIRNGKWGETVLLKQGFVDYHLVQPARAKSGRFWAVASELPRNQRRRYHLLKLDLSAATEFQQESWPGWEPIDLPVEEELTERRTIEIDGENYSLYWADLHCHSGLTTDAEGEHDELIHYARDKAKLDVVCFTNNDFLYDTFLTEYEFAIGNFLANTYTKEGTFIALPGYEWTARVPGKPGVPFSEPSTWTPPYQNRSYPNHRSVIFTAAAGPLIRFAEVANDIEKLNEAVESAGGLTLSQHEAFLLSGHKVEVGLELTSGWRNYMRIRPGLFHGSLKPGVRLGFTANGDTHRRAPGLSGALTGIYAKELTETAILDALRERRCFATNGSRIFVDSRVNGAFMGRESRVKNGRADLQLKAIGTRDILQAELIHNGKTKTQFECGTREIDIETYVDNLEAGEHWFYWKITQEGGGQPLPGNVEVAFGATAWSTPVWVIVE